MSDEAREEGFYWVVLGQNPPEIAYWERGHWRADLAEIGSPAQAEFLGRDVAAPSWSRISRSRGLGEKT